ncbi:FdtA/QdtA family cupin domain-containing protein [Pseudohaliea sp.]|uniref:sugar 3,4-ketoisomerase n=1 Tax=Pseudohaliea sp. TaxID=2740289 RepID=UPI0032EF4A00
MTGHNTGPVTEWFDGRARLLDIVRSVDERGTLTPLDFPALPFTPRRLFTVAGVPAGARRGGHGHRRGEQLLLCIAGRIAVRLAATGRSASLTLQADGPALLIGPGIWAEQRYAVPGSVLLVVASEPYDPASYFSDENGGP